MTRDYSRATVFFGICRCSCRRSIKKPLTCPVDQHWLHVYRLLFKNDLQEMAAYENSWLGQPRHNSDVSRIHDLSHKADKPSVKRAV